MNKIDLPNYDLNMTLLGGQAFNFDYDGECYWGFTQDKVIKLKQDVRARPAKGEARQGRHGTTLHWQTYPNNDDFEFLKSYLRIDVNYLKIIKKIQKDKYIKSAIKKYPGIRLLKQDFEQTLLSFLISSNNNIKSIRKIIRAMNQKFGRKIKIGDREIYLFPKTEVIADTNLNDLLECKLGFRAKFLKEAARELLKTNLNKKIPKMSENEARSKLLKIKGVGDKIADCVLVFSLDFDNVTPLDVWGKRVLTDFYKINPKMKYEKMRQWIDNYFEGYAGWAGQFLFEYIRHKI